ncbi:MAG: class I SAM-dependent methyltransferase [Aggregatilineales bacterium]
MITLDEATFLRLTRNEADMAFKKRVRCIFEWLEPTDDKVILDCGCGRGFYLNMLRAVSACQLYGLELEPEIIAKARANLAALPAITLVRASIYEQPFEDARFDGVILSEVLEHLDDDLRGLREVYRVLKPNGVVAITVPNADYPFWWDPINKTLETLGLPPIKRGVLAGIWANHVRLYRREQLRSVVEAAGFVVEEERAFTHYCFPFIHNLVYGVGKPLLESGALPKRMAQAADRTAFDQNDGSLLNPINLGLAILNWFDRPNRLSEPEGVSTVNLALKARKPA